jgi:hypothetical protein
MPANEPYVSAHFSVLARFYGPDGTSEIAEMRDIVAVSASFALNTIPAATILAAVGYNPLNNNSPATIHTLLPQIRQRQRVVVEIEVTPGGGDTGRITAGKYKIFDGFLAGIGFQRSHNQFNYVLNLVHWLDDLNNSSMIAGNWFPGVPDDYTVSAVIESLSGGGGQNIAASPRVRREYFADSNLSLDLWEKSIKQAFVSIAKGPVGLTNNEELKNDAALKALERMPGDAPNYVPLQLNTGASLQDAIATYFSGTIKESSGQTTFWGKLISEYCQQFLFAISPAVDWALPIPFCSGLRWKPGGKEIAIKDYSHANFNSNMSQIIESVNILYPLTSQNGIDFNRPDPPPQRVAYYKPAAQYPPQAQINQNDERKRGARLFKAAPVWFSHLSSAAAAGLLSAYDARTTAQPAAAPAGNAPPSGAQAIRSNSAVIERFAKQWFINEILQQRYGEISGPLRFDIAPGSIVKIELPPSSPTANTNEHVVASVIGVSYVINAEKAMAGTTFTLAHTKTSAENDDTSADFVTDAPPLYEKSIWYGGPLAIASTT